MKRIEDSSQKIEHKQPINMKIGSTFLDVREIVIKTTFGFFLKPVRRGDNCH